MVTSGAFSRPDSVVNRKRVVNLSRVGEVCKVKVTEKNKVVVYKAKILACGKLVAF